MVKVAARIDRLHELQVIVQEIEGLDVTSPQALQNLEQVAHKLRDVEWPSEEWFPERVRAALPGK